MGKKLYLCCLLILLFAALLGMAAGEKAEELTGSARFETNGGEKNYTLMTDGDLKTYFPLKEKKGILTISCEKPICGVYIMVFDKYGRGFGYDLQIPEGDGWKTVVQETGEYWFSGMSLMEGVLRSEYRPPQRNACELRKSGFSARANLRQKYRNGKRWTRRI